MQLQMLGLCTSSHIYTLHQVSDMFVGHRTGLPPLTTDPNDSDSDTEPEDEADEDSNGKRAREHHIIDLHNPLQTKNITKMTTQKKNNRLLVTVVRYFSGILSGFLIKSLDIFTDGSENEELVMEEESFGNWR